MIFESCAGEYIMAELKSGVILEPGENLVMEIEAELWAVSSNPIAVLFGRINKVIAAIFGTRRKGFLVITDKRVIEVTDLIRCYVFHTNKTVKFVLPSSVKEIGYEKETVCGIFCPAYNLYYESFTQKTMVMLKGANEAKANEKVKAFYKAICAAQ